MRLRNVKNKKEIMLKSLNLITEPNKNKESWSKVFQNNNPIFLEIGMGKGKFLLTQAVNNPDLNFIGIEKYDSVISRALEKIPQNIKNIYLIRMNAKDIDQVFSHEISRIYLNFSDPWPKKRHHIRRLTSEYFLTKYDYIFKNDNVIEMKTDNEELFAYSIETLSNFGYTFSEVTFDLHKKQPSNNVETEYETKFCQLNKKIYRLVAKKSKKI